MSQVIPDTSLLHRRQFVVARGPRLMKPDWRTYELAHGLVLSACPETAIQRIDDRDGHTWTLIGNAFQSARGEPRPADQVAILGANSVVGATYTWAGRWVLIGPEVVVPDACGLLGVFYLDPAAGGEFLASSSLAVIKELIPELAEDSRRLHWHGLSWFFVPSSKLERVKKLLPDQTLSLRGGGVSYLKRTFPERYEGMTTDERAGALLVNLGGALTELSEKGGRVSLALTAGIDSRSTLAAAITAGVKLEAVTMQHPRIVKADRVIPPAVCRRLGIEHSYLRPGRFDRGRAALYQAHTLGNSADADVHFFVRHVFDQLGDTAWLIRSGPWSMAKAYWFGPFGDVSWGDLRRQPEAFILRHRTFSNLRQSAESLREYVSWRDGHPEPYDWKDLWVRDQRMAGLVSAIEQSLDLLDCNSVVAVNCSALFDIMLSEPETSRRQKKLQLRLLELSGTGLEAIPINPTLDSSLSVFLRRVTWHACNVALETGNVVRGLAAERRR
jgi:hypothetical protein